MQKRLAATTDGRITYCSCSPDQMGKGRCNHVTHQMEGETEQQFIERVGSSTFDVESDTNNPSQDNKAINKEWNQNALQETMQILENGNCCIINQATGTGKSSIMGAVIDKYYKEQSVFLSPLTPINSAFAGYNQNSRSMILGNLSILTYQSLLSNTSSKEDFENFCDKMGIKLPIKVLCMDEIHHLGGDTEDKDDKKWKEAVENLIKFGTDESTKFVGATATIGDNSEDILDGRFTKDKISSRLSFEEAIERGILKLPNIISKPNTDEFLSRYTKQNADISKRRKNTGITSNIKDGEEFVRNIEEEFRRQVDKAMSDKIAENDREGKSTNVLIFSKSVKEEEFDLEKTVNMLKKKYPNKKVVGSFFDSTANGKKNKGFFDDFCHGKLNDNDTIYVLSTFGTLNEGVHTNASIIIQNRPTSSKSIHDQQQGRVLDMDSDKHNLIIDNVGTYSGNRYHNYSPMSKANGTIYHNVGMSEMVKFDYLQEYSCVYNGIAKQAQKPIAWSAKELAKTHIESAHKKINPDGVVSREDISIGHFTKDNFFSIKCQKEMNNYIRDCKLEGVSSNKMAIGIYDIVSKYPEYEEYLKIIGKEY